MLRNKLHVFFGIFSMLLIPMVLRSVVLVEAKGFDAAELYISNPVSISIKNGGDGVVVLEAVTPDCNCLAFNEANGVIEPGEALTVAGVLFGRELGPFNRILSIKSLSENGDASTTDFVIEGSVIRAKSDVFISAVDLLSRKSEYEIWDVRPADDYMRFHLPGSKIVNIAKNAPNSPGRPVVLVTAGYPTIRQLHYARGVKGRNLYFIDGGIGAWAASGGALKGIAPKDVSVLMASADSVVDLSKAEPKLWLADVDPLSLGMAQHFELEVWDGDFVNVNPDGIRPQYILAKDRRSALELAYQNLEVGIPIPVISGGAPAFISALSQREFLEYAMQHAGTERVTTAPNGNIQTISSRRKLPGCSTCPN
ncbi:rhodanese-like domain-containing protein [Cerasicoccus maritimus]|uniref:rhodanese-like domain-containing protein n=1 Tax=Cerasicoccus maritimus TaxID=490089 RepID=UPI002852798D|nr:rhodanese-like domain-containing protein [Cerasicoccus maritimus]